ncbi:helix-turn-helix domain-containing protein [Streptomyces sp. NPDC051561]|uniref:helix-turn-helix domain-containing protein n=1 Tax=Streptomyces sp. NPDC051561 TaxID=3365658 RepID=UPI0037986860
MSPSYQDSSLTTTPPATGTPVPLPPPKERRRLREAKTLSQAQVAAIVGVTRETVRSWENGRTSPRGRKRETYARLLVGIAEELRTTGTATPVRTPTRPTNNPSPHEAPTQGAPAPPAKNRTRNTSDSPAPSSTTPSPSSPARGTATPDDSAHSTAAPARSARGAKKRARAAKHPAAPGRTSQDAAAPAAPARATTDPADLSLAVKSAVGPTVPASQATPVTPVTPVTPSSLAPTAPNPPAAPVAPAAPATLATPPTPAAPETSVATPTPTTPAAPPVALDAPAASADPSDPAAPANPDDTLTDPAAPAHAFDQLYAHTAPSLLRQAYLLTGRHRLSHESVQHAFDLAWQRWPEVATDRDPAGWVRAAAYEYAMSPWHRLRRSHRRIDPPTAPHPPGKDGEAESNTGTQPASDPTPTPGPGELALLNALLELPPPYRRTLVLYDGLGLDLPETAAETEATTPATANRLEHARTVIARELPELAEARTPAEQSTLVQERLSNLARAQRTDDLPPGERVRIRSERRTRFWTRAAIAFTTLIVGATAFTLATAPTEYQSARPPGEPVGGLPALSGPQRLSTYDKQLRAKLRAEPSNGPERLLPQPR